MSLHYLVKDINFISVIESIILAILMTEKFFQLINKFYLLTGLS